MPELNPSAGFVPIWETVLAHMEHCAFASLFIKEKEAANNKMKSIFFMI